MASRPGAHDRDGSRAVEKGYRDRSRTGHTGWTSQNQGHRLPSGARYVDPHRDSADAGKASAEHEKELASTLTNWLRDDESRSEAIRILQAFPLARFSALIEQIAESSADRAARAGASIEDQQRTRETWRDDARGVAELFDDLGQRLRAPRGVPFRRTLKEWTHFEQKFVQSLRGAGLSYGDIAKLRRSAVSGSDVQPAKHRLERERVRGSARRAKSRKA